MLASVSKVLNNFLVVCLESVATSPIKHQTRSLVFAERGVCVCVCQCTSVCMCDIKSAELRCSIKRAVNKSQIAFETRLSMS